ncbi:MAG: rod shape-determining protein MreC [Chloroflexota bacterium]
MLSAGGSLAGSITELGGNWASVRLINDTRSVVVGRDVRSGATGEVHGNLSAPLQLQNVPFNQSLRVGDLVMTAGIRVSREARSQFPRDLVIGSIVNVDKDPAAITISALVQPAADLDNLELVLVVTDFKPDLLPGVNPTPTPDPTTEPDESEPTPAPTRKPRRTQRPDG